MNSYLSNKRLFIQRVNVLQEVYEIPWEEAVAIAHLLAKLVKDAELRELFKHPAQRPDGTAT